MAIQLSEHFTYKKLLRFVLPSIVMMVFVSVYSVVDGLFISNFVGDDALAAINLIFPFIMICGAIGFMLGAGGSALVSKTLGEGDRKRANEYFSMLVYVTAGIGIAIAAGGQLAVPAIAEWFVDMDRTIDAGKREYILGMCILYGRVLLAAQPFFILQNIFQSFFVTAEKPRLGLIVTACAGVTNMALDALFVAGFKWGIAGAAAATAASQLFGGIFPLFYFFRKNSSLLRLTGTRFYGKAFLKCVTNGSSEFLSNVASALIILLFNNRIMGIIGMQGVTAYSAIGYIMMIFFSVFMGYSVGSAPLIGYNYGAQNREEMRNLYKKSLIIVTVFGVIMTVFSEACAYPIVSIFGFDAELTALTVRGFRIYSTAFAIAGYGVFASSMFTALNNGLISGIISFLRTLVFQITALMVLPMIWGLDGVWAATCVGDIFAVAVSVVFLVVFRHKYGYALIRKKEEPSKEIRKNTDETFTDGI